MEHWLEREISVYEPNYVSCLLGVVIPLTFWVHAAEERWGVESITLICIPYSNRSFHGVSVSHYVAKRHENWNFSTPSYNNSLRNT